MTSVTIALVTTVIRRVGLEKLLVMVAVLGLASLPAMGQCTGDCNGDNVVATDELVLMVHVALGTASPDACAALANENDPLTIDRIVQAVDNALNGCVGTTPRPTPTVTPTVESNGKPTPTGTVEQTPTATVVPVCGNNIIEGDENCDRDGNDSDGDDCPNGCVVTDTCPAGCIIHSCLATPDTFDVDVIVNVPSGANVGALQVFLRYPDGAVSLPGSGNQAQIAIVNLPDDAFNIGVNDLDWAVHVLTLGPDGLTLGDTPPNRFFTAEFNLCQGASAPSPSDFRCVVENATDVDQTVLTAQTTCTVSLP